MNGGLEDKATGYSAILPFSSEFAQSSKPVQTTVAGLGLMTGAADPMMLFPGGTTFTPYSELRNISDAPVSLTSTLWWMENGTAHSAQLPSITLSPSQSQRLDLGSALSTLGSKSFSGSFNLVFEGQMKPGALLMASGSVDQTNTYVFESVPRAVSESGSKSLQYWSTGNGDDTMVTVWNPADEAQDFAYTLFFSGGHYTLPLHLEPRATRSFNVSEIIQNQVPDAEGNIIPASIHEGGAKLSGSHAENEHILVAIDSGTYNVRKATCSNNCQQCDGYSSASLIDIPFAVAVGGTHQQNFTLTWNSGTQYNFNGNGQWSSSNTSIATVATGLVRGVSPGSPKITVAANGEPVEAGYICTGNLGCPTSGFVQSSSGTVSPHITALSPNYGADGTSPTVTISGSGFGTSPTVGADGSGITITVLTNPAPTDSSIAATFAIAANAPVADQDISVMNGNTPSDNSVTFQVTPAGSAVPVNFHLTTAQDLGGGVALGIERNFAWQSSSGNLNDLSSCSMREYVTYDTTNNSTCPNNSPPQQCYYPASPPWAKSGQGSAYPNPTSPTPQPATGGTSQDQNSVTNLNFVKPYAANSFSSKQYVQYSCNGGSWVSVYGPITITRSVSQSGSTWFGTVSASDTTVTSRYTLP